MIAVDEQPLQELTRRYEPIVIPAQISRGGIYPLMAARRR